MKAMTDPALTDPQLSSKPTILIEVTANKCTGAERVRGERKRKNGKSLPPQMRVMVLVSPGLRTAMPTDAKKQCPKPLEAHQRTGQGSVVGFGLGSAAGQVDWSRQVMGRGYGAGEWSHPMAQRVCGRQMQSTSLEMIAL